MSKAMSNKSNIVNEEMLLFKPGKEKLSGENRSFSYGWSTCKDPAYTSVYVMAAG